jgi:hypothetical protein
MNNAGIKFEDEYLGTIIIILEKTEKKNSLQEQKMLKPNPAKQVYSLSLHLYHPPSPEPKDKSRNKNVRHEKRVGHFKILENPKGRRGGGVHRQTQTTKYHKSRLKTH